MPSSASATTEIYTLSLHDALPISTTITVTGSGFTSNSVVLLDGVSLPTTFVSGSSLRADVNVATAGAALAEVWTPGAGISNGASITVNPSPSITSLRPFAASVGQTSVLFTIIGTDLDAVTRVEISSFGNADPGITASS